MIECDVALTICDTLRVLRIRMKTVKPRVRPRIALLVETSRSYGRELLRGIARFGGTLSGWTLLRQEMSIDETIPHWVIGSNVQGVIARVDDHNIDALRALRVPIVDVRCSKKFDGVPQVETDDRDVARLAFEHLCERGFRRFAYCGFPSAHYSINRLKYFRDWVNEAGCELSVYATHSAKAQPLSHIEGSGIMEADLLARWLRSLEPPTGIFVCNDIRGQQVLNACQTENIVVPDELAVIGVDNDDTICPLCAPPLSSVRPNAEQVGYRAAEILSQMLRGVSPSQQIEFIPPRNVVARLSTQANAVEDREVARLCHFIREHACDGIKVVDVERFSELSRRQLERRFRKELNHTIHDEITAVQMARVKQLLSETTMNLDEIAHLAGYRHTEQLSTVFKRETGQTPGQFRRTVADKPVSP